MAQQVFGFVAGLVNQQVAANQDCISAAGAGKGARQQLVGNLLFQLLPFLAADFTGFLCFDFGDFFVQDGFDDRTR